MNILEINTMDIEGGAAKVAWRLKTYLEKSSNQVSMFVKHKYSNDKNVYEINSLNSISNFFLKICGKDIWSALQNKFRPLLANDVEFFGTDKILNTTQFKNADVVHCHNLHGQYFDIKTLEKMSAKKPIIWTLHDMWSLTPHCAHTTSDKVVDGFFTCNSLSDYQDIAWDNSKHLSSVKKETYKNSKFEIVVPCLWLKEKVEKSALAQKNIHVIPNGIDTSIFKSGDKIQARMELGLPKDKKIMLFAANGGLENIDKGGDLVKEIAQKFQNDKNVIFLVIGENSERIDKNCIFFKYEKDESKMAKYYCASDLLLFPSKAETLPLSILESMSCGTPAICSNVGGISEIIDHRQNGFLMTERSDEQISAGIKWFFDQDTNSRKAVIERGAEKIQKNFSIESMIDGYMKLYSEIIRK